MPGIAMMAYSEDDIALAAEYALGPLDATERAQVETMMSDDTDFTAMVEAWEHKLGVLNQMVGSVEPPAEVWNRIRTSVGLPERRAPLAIPQAPPVSAVVPVVDTALVETGSNVVQFSSHARRWRNIATASMAIAAAL